MHKTLSLLAAAAFAVSAGHAIPATPGDFTGDLRADILWRHGEVGGSGENYLYPMNGTTILGTEGYLRTVSDLNWRVAGIGDFDGDGKSDVLWRNSSTGENYIYFMDGTTIKPTEGYIRSVVDQSWQVAGVGDFNGDLRADILWRNSATGENYLYPMNGLTILGTEGYLRTVPDLNWKVVGVGNFDSDTKADILWRNAATGENYIYPMDGTAILGTEGYIRTVADLNWKVVGVGDFDGDGRSDILWRNTGTGEDYIYPMSGTTILGTEGYIRTVVDLAWQVVAVGDYNLDGRADILWRHASTGENYVYPMNGTTILGSEGYIRTVADRNWKVQPAAACASVSSPAITLPAAASIPSRVSGIAPLAVFFDATATTATSTTRPFHEIEFAWNFGDRSSGVWTPTGLSRNLATGGVAAHVYETPGTYEVCLTAFDGTNTSMRSITIAVIDPEDVTLGFGGTKTTCVRATNDGSFNGCPLNATQVTNADFANAISTQATAGRRVLFRRGDSWTTGTATAALAPNSSTGGMIGAFGSGARPRIARNPSGSNDPLLAIGSGSSPNFADWRIVDLEFDGTLSTNNALGLEFRGRANRITMLRLNIHDTPNGGIYLSEFSSDLLGQVWREIAVVETTITNTSYNSYFAAEKAAWLGNTLFNSLAHGGGVGLFRTQYFTKSVMSNNSMGGSPTGFHVLKFGAPRWAAADGGLPLYMGKYTELAVVSDNVFDDRTGRTGWMLPFGPENGETEERVRDIVIERNWSRSGDNNDNHYIFFNCTNMTIRNNVIDMSTGTNVDHNGVAVADRGKGPLPDGIRIYNNTIYRGDTANGPFHAINLFQGSNIIVRNNLASAPSVSAKDMVNVGGSVTGTVQSNNLLTNTPGFVGPLTSPAGFRLSGSGAGTVNTGFAVPVFSDFLRKTRPNDTARELGAMEF